MTTSVAIKVVDEANSLLQEQQAFIKKINYENIQLQNLIINHEKEIERLENIIQRNHNLES
jgi:hypothetical protein